MPFIPPRQAKYFFIIIILLVFFLSQGTVSSFLAGHSHHALLHILANYLHPILGLHNLLLTITARSFTRTETAGKNSSQGRKNHDCFPGVLKELFSHFYEKG